MTDSETAQTDFAVMPKPTAWPLVVGVAAAMIAVGLMTNLVISITGIGLLLVGVGGWIGQLIPGRGLFAEPFVPVDQRPGPVARSSRHIADPRQGLPAHRGRFPEEIHPYSTAALGGLVGGAVMGLTALIYGLVSGRGVFYPVNLLAAIVVRRFNEGDTELLAQFDATAFWVALLIHLIASGSLGLIYGMILPMLPRSPMYWAGLVAPLMWSGLVYGLMGVINPVMNQHVDWYWFILSQFAFGITLGWWISKRDKVEWRPGQRVKKSKGQS